MYQDVVEADFCSWCSYHKIDPGHYRLLPCTKPSKRPPFLNGSKSPDKSTEHPRVPADSTLYPRVLEVSPTEYTECSAVPDISRAEYIEYSRVSEVRTARNTKWRRICRVPEILSAENTGCILEYLENSILLGIPSKSLEYRLTKRLCAPGYLEYRRLEYSLNIVIHPIRSIFATWRVWKGKKRCVGESVVQLLLQIRK